MSRPKIFLCHDWKNKELVFRIEAALKSVGLSVWVDHSEVHAPDVIPVHVSKAIKSCEVMVLIWSKPASQSNWVEREWSAAFNLNKQLIVCRLDNTEVPPILMGSAHIQFKNIDQGIADLIKAFKAGGDNGGERRSKGWFPSKCL